MFIVSYIKKDERELSNVLRQASKQACGKNIKQQLRQLGNVFLIKGKYQHRKQYTELSLYH
jgi:hypothetical protein